MQLIEQWLEQSGHTLGLFPIFYQLGVTPNGLTSLSLLFGLLSAQLLAQNKLWFSALCYFLFYWFDCLDGNYARSYQMTSKIGEWYDHTTDLLVGILIYCQLFPKIGFLAWLIIKLLILADLMLTGCQVKIKEVQFSEASWSLIGLTKYLCVTEPKKTVEMLRSFGPTTLTMFTIFFIILAK